MIGFCPLASGSKGNCLYVGSESTRVLVDAGLSGRATKERLLTLGVSLDSIDAILVTHEHHDHIAGLKQLAVRRGIPVYANADTARGLIRALQVAPPNLRIFTTGDSFEIGDLSVRSVPILHDTLEPVAFVIRACGRAIGICTDLGIATPVVKEAFRHCDHLVVEANHDPQMVCMSARPAIYKQRVLGRYGHLSNEGCRDLLEAIWHTQLRSIHLAHLSEECNRAELALETMEPLRVKAQGELELAIAWQHQPSLPIVFS